MGSEIAVGDRVRAFFGAGTVERLLTTDSGKKCAVVHPNVPRPSGIEGTSADPSFVVETRKLVKLEEIDA